MSPWAPLVAPFAARFPPRAPCQRPRLGQSTRTSASLALATLLLLSIVSRALAERVHWRREDLQQQVDGLQPTSSPGGEKPRLIPLVAAESGYSENSSVNILCTVSQGHHETLTFDWFKDGQLLAETGAGGEQAAELGALNLAPQIEQHSDHSLLRISRVLSQHSGRYTCSAKSKFGKDSSSVNLAVNVKLQWTKEPPKEIVVSVNQELKVDCLAQGEPKPSMRWERLESSASSFAAAANSRRAGGPHYSGNGEPPLTAPALAAGAIAKNQLAATKDGLNGYKLALQHQNSHSQTSVLVSSNRYLNIQRARESDAGLYECIASNSHDADLRKLVHVQVRGPPKILPIASADSYPEGSSINLICTVSGGQRRGLVLSWLMNGQPLNEETLKSSDSFDNVSIGAEDSDISFLKIRNATNINSGTYTCNAKNPLGQDSTSVKIMINIELKWDKIPKDVEVGLNKELSVECDAVGFPEPKIEWTKHADRHLESRVVSKGKVLKLAKAQHGDSGLYECVAKNGVDDDLRKVIQVKVRGKYSR